MIAASLLVGVLPSAQGVTRFACLPNVGASPNGPVAFNVSTQALVHILDTATNRDTGLTINLHAAVAAQPEGTRKLFLAARPYRARQRRKTLGQSPPGCTMLCGNPPCKARIPVVGDSHCGETR